MKLGPSLKGEGTPEEHQGGKFGVLPALDITQHFGTICSKGVEDCL